MVERLGTTHDWRGLELRQWHSPLFYNRALKLRDVEALDLVSERGRMELVDGAGKTCCV